ncbi:histidine phosphatase family protein [Nocardioides sp.]|uniref:histidine phosphatase family protein n=1 Tax=Nocardioides sp. TaxID=35761 RepID=UPI00271E71BD|nr:histidine phosphatase family protein [Nocardioides sp.]MDO9457174.1 histidine phosphatase family protein [Nocardioides sp.]
MGRVLLVRHGQASFGADDYDVLSPTGWEQGRLLGTWLGERGVTPTSLVRGDMRRHRETLEAVAETAGWGADATVDAGWDEFDHLGIVAGHPDVPSLTDSGSLDRRAFQRVFEEATARWTSGEGDYDETWVGFVARVRSALDRVAAGAGSGETTVVVTSGGVIGVVAAVLADPDDDDPASLARRWSRFNAVMVNASVSRLVVGSTGARLLTFNEHPHLEGHHLTYR